MSEGRKAGKPLWSLGMSIMLVGMGVLLLVLRNSVRGEPTFNSISNETAVLIFGGAAVIGFYLRKANL